MMTGWIAALLMAAQGAPATATPGTVTVEAVGDKDMPAAALQAFVEAVESALVDARFVALPAPPRGRYVARISVSRSARGEVAATGRDPGGSAVATWGGGVSVSLPSGKRKLRGLIVTQLTVEIVARAGGKTIWTGRALTAQAEGTGADMPAALAAKLAPAAVGGFPTGTGDPVSVP